MSDHRPRLFFEIPAEFGNHLDLRFDLSDDKKSYKVPYTYKGDIIEVKAKHKKTKTNFRLWVNTRTKEFSYQHEQKLYGGGYYDHYELSVDALYILSQYCGIDKFFYNHNSINGGVVGIAGFKPGQSRIVDIKWKDKVSRVTPSKFGVRYPGAFDISESRELRKKKEIEKAKRQNSSIKDAFGQDISIGDFVFVTTNKGYQGQAVTFGTVEMIYMLDNHLCGHNEPTPARVYIKVIQRSDDSDLKKVQVETSTNKSLVKLNATEEIALRILKAPSKN